MMSWMLMIPGWQTQMRNCGVHCTRGHQQRKELHCWTHTIHTLEHLRAARPAFFFLESSLDFSSRPAIPLQKPLSRLECTLAEATRSHCPAIRCQTTP